MQEQFTAEILRSCIQNSKLAQLRWVPCIFDTEIIDIFNHICEPRSQWWGGEGELLLEHEPLFKWIWYKQCVSHWAEEHEMVSKCTSQLDNQSIFAPWILMNMLSTHGGVWSHWWNVCDCSTLDGSTVPINVLPWANLLSCWLWTAECPFPGSE